MKRKNLFFVSALILFGLTNVNSAKAEVPPTQTSDQVTVNIKFRPIQTIMVNQGLDVVDFLYETPDDYQSGIAAIEVSDQLTVNSSGPFIVNVISTDFVAQGFEAIPASDMTVTAIEGTGNHRTGTTYETPPVELSTVGVPFITSTGGGMGLNFNVKYQNTGFDETYVDMLTNAETTYTATVTYTITSN